MSIHQRTCSSCGSSSLEPGTVQSTGRLHFRPANTKFLTFGTNEVRMESHLCMDCCLVMLSADMEKAVKLLDRVKAS